MKVKKRKKKTADVLCMKNDALFPYSTLLIKTMCPMKMTIFNKVRMLRSDSCGVYNKSHMKRDAGKFKVPTEPIAMNTFILTQFTSIINYIFLPKSSKREKSVVFRVYLFAFSCSAGATILCVRPVGLLAARTPISRRATFSL